MLTEKLTLSVFVFGLIAFWYKVSAKQCWIPKERKKKKTTLRGFIVYHVIIKNVKLWTLLFCDSSGN